MASYKTGGMYAFDGHGLGIQDVSGQIGAWYRLGDTFSFTGEDDSAGTVNRFYRDNDAYIDTDEHITSPHNILLLASQTIGNKTLYIGHFGMMNGGVMYPQVVLSEDEDLTNYFISYGASYSDTWHFGYNWLYFYKKIVSSNVSELWLAYGGNYEGTPLELASAQDLVNNHEGFGYNPNTICVLTLDGANVDPDDLPMEPDASAPDGGYGNYDNDSDNIPVPTLPVLGPANSGFLTVYNPTIAELHSFANFLWSQDVFDTIKKFIASPMELIVSLSVVPVEPVAGSSTQIKIGGIATGVSSTVVPSSYLQFNCGSVNVREYYGNALDYSATKMSIFLPFIGMRELKTDEIMGGTINVVYNVDIVSGSCVAFVLVSKWGLTSVLYSFEGNLASQIPIASRDFSTVYTSIARGVIDTAVSAGTGNMIGAGASAGQTAMAVMAGKPTMTRSGSLSATAGLMNIPTPYIVVERPVQSYPKDALKFYGAPSNITARLGDLKGYTEVESVILDIACTDEELGMIEEKLKEGVIL